MSIGVRVVVVDDHPLFREGVVAALSVDRYFKFVGQGASGREALELAVEKLPDILLLDISLPGGGLEATRAITAAAPSVKVVMLTMSEDQKHVVGSLEAGARGYVVKGISPADLSRTLKSIMEGHTYVTPQLAAHLLRKLRQDPTGSSTGADLFAQLTAREIQILECVASGQTNREIAVRLAIAEKTVKHYMTSIMEKLQVRNRVEAAMKMRERKPDRSASAERASFG